MSSDGASSWQDRREFLGLSASLLFGCVAQPMTMPAHASSADGGGAADGDLTLFLCGDVMTGRGIDQILPHPCDPQLFEPVVDSAMGYVELAERENGPIARGVDFAYPWGDALSELGRRRPDLRIINLETAVTCNGQPAPKGINYRMSPDNFRCIAEAGVDCCVLANNHVLDWGEAGLSETLSTIGDAGIAMAGAGTSLNDAERPAVLASSARGRVLVFSWACRSSGVPGEWAARKGGAGVNLLPDLSSRTAQTVIEKVMEARRPGDIVVVSIHWGRNWGYDVAGDQRQFAHQLLEAGAADIVHGHSSHHPKGIEVYRGRLILYGCGDFLNDYEGIRGHETYRDDLVLMYLPEIRSQGTLSRLSMVPFRIRNFRLNRASREEAEWLTDVLDRESRKLGAGVRRTDEDELVLEWS